MEYKTPSFMAFINSLDYLDSEPKDEETQTLSSSDPDFQLEAEFVECVQPVRFGSLWSPGYCKEKWLSSKSAAQALIGVYGSMSLKTEKELYRIIYTDSDESCLTEDAEVEDSVCDTDDGYGKWVGVDQEPDIENPDFDWALDRMFVETTMADRYCEISEEDVPQGSALAAALICMRQAEARLASYGDGESWRDAEDWCEPVASLERTSVEKVECAAMSLLPTHSYFDDTFYQALEENNDFKVDMDAVKLRSCDVDWYRDPERYYQPVINVNSGQRRVGTQKTALTALKKRNADVPELGSTVAVHEFAKAVADKFMASFVEERCLDGFFNVLDAGFKYFQKWKSHPELREEPFVIPQQLNLQRYQHMIKTDVKPVVNDGMHVERAVPATITFHGKGVTSVWSPWFTSLFEQFQRSLKSRFIVPIGKITSLEIKNLDLNNKYFLEVDLSKFDKSQGEIHLEFQRLILCYLRFPKELTDWWCDFHRDSYISDPQAKVAMHVSFQRRTGDAFTYFGNTLVTMAMMAWVYDMSQFEKGIFSGDDSLLISKHPIRGAPEQIVTAFNMEAKITEPCVPYICSKFLVNDSCGHAVSIPDPLREVQRLAKKKILKDEKVLREHFQSFCDRMKFLRSMTWDMEQQLEIYFELKYKYKMGPDVREVLSGCRLFSDNFKNFQMCFLADPSGKLLYCRSPLEILQDKDSDHHFKWLAHKENPPLIDKTIERKYGLKKWLGLPDTLATLTAQFIDKFY